MISCERVSYAATSDGRPSTPLLQDVTFEAMPGTIVLVRGASGAGKSTLLSLLACVRRPTSGQVCLDGRPVSRYTARHRDQMRRVVGYMPQQLHLFDELTALENVYLPLLAAGVSRSEGASRCAAMLDTLEIAGGESRSVRSLSGGERQRVAVARALVSRPRVIVLDEPTAHQDDDRVRIVLGLLEEVRARQGMAIVAAHDARLDGWAAVDQTLHLQGGRLARRTQ